MAYNPLARVSWSLKDIIGIAQLRQKNKFDCNIVVSGDRGNGKSTLIAKALYLTKKYKPQKHQVYSREDVIERKLFGTGKMHPKFEEFVGDYLAIAVKNKGIVYSEESMQFVSHHAGLTEKELIIPLIAVGKR